MASSSPSIELPVGDRVVRISNPDRVYFPESGATKLDLVNYYLSVGNGIVRDLLLTGRSINAKKAQTIGLVSQMVAQGKHLDAARAAAKQATRSDRDAQVTCKEFMKPVPYAELELEKQHFKRLVQSPVVEAALKKFVESTDVRPYLP